MIANNENPFKKLETQEEPSKELKKKVMTSIGLAEMLIGFTELFTVNMACTASEIMKASAVKSENLTNEKNLDRKSDRNANSESHKYDNKY